jgi:hypothetical protein
MLDRAFTATVRNFSTLFLAAAAVFVPLHLAHAYWFRDVIAVSELHPDIKGFPKTRLVRGVGKQDLAAARASAVGVTVVEIALLPALVGAAGRVLEQDDLGEVPGALRALRRLRRPRLPPSAAVGPALVAVVVAVAMGWSARALAAVVVEPLPGTAGWLGTGLAEGCGRALGAAWLIGALASLGRSRAPRDAEDT